MMKNKSRLILLVACMALLSPLFSYSQHHRLPVEQLHHETSGDKYLPNAFDDKKTSPGYKYRSNEHAKMTGVTSVFTIQVNVNSNGQNILGDAANEPSIAISPVNQNQMVIGWRQFDNVSSNFRQAGWGYTSDAGQHWTFPGKIEAGIFRSDPVLDCDLNGNFFYNSLTNSPDYYCKVFKSINGGASWDNGADARGGDKQWMAIDRTAGVGSGNIYAFWSSYYSTCNGYFTRSTNGGNSFENCIAITPNGDPSLGTMAVGNAGEVYTVGRSQSSYDLVVAKSWNAQIPASTISWDFPVDVFMDGYIDGNISVNPAGLLGQANIDVDRSNGAGRDNVYVLASVGRISNSDSGDVMFAASTDGGLTWSLPQRINDDVSTTNTQWFGTMSVAPNGRIDAVWLDTRDAPSGSDTSALYYSYSIDQGNSWSVNEKISGTFNPNLGYPNQNKMGDYFDMESDNTGAHLAWANTFNGEEDVYYSRIVPAISTSANEISDKTSFSIFPNPVSSQFTIQNIQFQIKEIELYNIVGEIIYSEILNLKSPVSNHSIDISEKPAGVYFLKILNLDGSSAVKKIIKE